MSRRALIVDDEPAVCQLIQGVLTSSGLDSLTLTKSAEATGYLRDEKFDVVLLDFAMPLLAGLNSRNKHVVPDSTSARPSS